MMSTHAAGEDYLKAIYQHTEWQDDPITPSELAARLRVAPASITGMIKKLAAEGFVNHRPYGPLRLTAAGTERALGVIRRHRLIETWLVTEMGFGWHEVHEEAEILEHALSDRLLDAIDERLGWPQRDPHGDAIPRADGSMPRASFTLLGDAAVGDVGAVLRLSDRYPEMLRVLELASIAPGTEIEVRDASERGHVVGRGGGASVTLTTAWARAIWITPSPT